ncbi:MAG: [Clostridia bacterium]|nr:[FeFe] hydrogenase H-cluster maturation GTPase HydF [Clostridia bacterium]
MANLNETVSAERIHIGFFGIRNAGKSSVVNAVTGQQLALVSDVKGTTTDPVKKAMELLPLGPVVIIDTPGIDDTGALGEMRVERTHQMLAQTDLAILVADTTVGLQDADRDLLRMFQERKLPYLVAFNKSDLKGGAAQAESSCPDADAVPAENRLFVSAATGENIFELKERIGALAKGTKKERKILEGLVEPGDTVVLVIPVDKSAPKGRIILPQQQVLRELLDNNCTAVVAQASDLPQALAQLKYPPKLVITDSQAFKSVMRDTPEDVAMTSFSILFSRYKGNLLQQIRGTAQLAKLTDDDTVLISEGCTHHRQCQDIGTVKIPGWVEHYCGARPSFEWTSGGEFPQDLSPYACVIHCGGCMLNEKEMHHRLAIAEAAGTPMTNYGLAIAEFHGILRRALRPFPDILKELEG